MQGASSTNRNPGAEWAPAPQAGPEPEWISEFGFPASPRVQASVLPSVPDAAGLRVTLLEAAKDQFRRGNFIAAQACLELVRRPGADPADTWLALSRLHFAVGDFEAAGRTCGYAAAYRPQDADLQARLALICFRLGDLRCFEIHLARALALDEENVNAWQLLADLNREHGRMDDAARCYRKLLERDSHHPGHLVCLAQCLCQLGQTAEAGEVLERLAQISRLAVAIADESPTDDALHPF